MSFEKSKARRSRFIIHPETGLFALLKNTTARGKWQVKKMREQKKSQQ
jgi:hypothetical protein